MVAVVADTIPLQAVYQIPTEEDTPSQSVALALQRVFYNLQTSDQAVGKTYCCMATTRSCTRSDTMQHIQALTS